jgi:gluconate 5-dehydrogenase
MDKRECAIVTGAGSGIGAATAAKLAGVGFCVVLTGRQRAKLDQTAARIAADDNVRVVGGDIREAATADRLLSTVLDAWGRLDVIVNSAGIASRVAIAEVSPLLLEEEMQTNAFGPAQLIAKAWPIFVKQRRGTIVNISSLASSDPLPGFFSYGASKAALESLGRSVAREGAPLGIRAYNISPGAVATPLLEALFTDAPPQAAMSPNVIAEVVFKCIRGLCPDASTQTIVVTGS